MPETPPVQNPNPQAIVGRLRMAVLLISLPFGVLMFMLPIVGRAMGASAVEIGGLYSAFALITVVLRPIIGRALDRFGRRPFFLAGVAGYSLANLLYATASSIGMLFLARAFQGLGSGLVWLSAYAMIADLAGGDERGGRFGQIEEVSPRGGIIGFFVIFGLMQLLGQDVGWSAGFYLYTAVGLGVLILSALGIPETRHTGNPSPAAAPALSLHVADLKGTVTRPFAILLGVVFLTASAYALTGPILMIYLQDHITRDIAPLAAAYLPAALVYAYLPSRLGRLSDRWGRRLPMLVALVAGGIVSISISQLRILWPLIVLWGIEAACFSAATPAEEALVADLSPAHGRGFAYGLYTAATNSGVVFGPLLGGWIYEALGAQYPFFFNAGLLWVAAMTFFLLRVGARVPAPVADARPELPEEDPAGPDLNLPS